MPRPGERRRASTRSRPSPTSRPPTSRRTSAAWRRVREELEKARTQGARSRRSRSWPRSSRRSPPKVKLLAQARRREAGDGRGRAAPHLRGAAGRQEPSTPTGIYDDAMRLAVRRFQQKHMIYEANYLRRKTVDALARPLLDNDYDDLVRALRERVVSAAGDRRGRLGVEGAQPGRRVHEDDAGAAAADRRRRRRWRSSSATRRPSSSALRVAVKLPPRPDYYSRQHGPLDRRRSRRRLVRPAVRRQTGHYKPQPRKKYPTLTLYTKVGGKQIAARALAHDHRRLARGAGEQRLRVLPLQGVGRRPARDPQRRLGAGLDRARVDADPRR